MNGSAAHPDREVLAELLLRWEELYEQGQDTPAATLAGDRPDLIPALSRRIDALKTVFWVTQPLVDPPDSDECVLPSGREAGKVLQARYRLEKMIATGGFAEVYRAFDEELQRTVAVKLPRPGRLESNESFLVEARQVARLKHEAIVPVYDVGSAGDTCFIVSEFLEGGSLADRLVGPRPRQEDVIRWICEIAEAADYAHLHGVVHRDIKLGNILLDHRGRAKLADFGIAQSASKAADDGPSLGTLRYMSPEQLEPGQRTDHRTDIFSLGIVLHEMLTGEAPYESFEPQDLRRDILAGRTKLSESLPPRLRDVCARAVSLSPTARHVSAAQFAAEVRRAAAPGDPARRSWLVPVVSVALIGGAALLASRGFDQRPSPPGLAPLSSAEMLAEAKNLFFQHKHAEAEAAFTAYLERVPDDVEALMRRGLSRTARGAFASGVDDFSRAIELKPGDAILHKHRAMALASQRQFEPAITDYEKALSLDPSDRETRESFGACYSIMAAEKADRKEFANAAEIMDKAIAVYPESAVFRHQRGSCLFHMGAYERAIADLDEAIHMEPGKPDHYENRGHCYLRLGKQEEADREFKKAEKLRNP